MKLAKWHKHRLTQVKRLCTGACPLECFHNEGTWATLWERPHGEEQRHSAESPGQPQHMLTAPDKWVRLPWIIPHPVACNESAQERLSEELSKAIYRFISNNMGFILRITQFEVVCYSTLLLQGWLYTAHLRMKPPLMAICSRSSTTRAGWLATTPSWLLPQAFL